MKLQTAPRLGNESIGQAVNRWFEEQERLNCYQYKLVAIVPPLPGDGFVKTVEFFVEVYQRRQA